MPPTVDRNIRSIAAYLQSLWDWTEFNECFAPTKIRITDIDGLVERNGKFLIIDGKKPTAYTPTGQKILFQQLQKTGFTAIFAYGYTASNIPNERCRSGAEAMIVDIGRPMVEKLEIYYPFQTGCVTEDPANNARLQEIIRAWFVASNANRVFHP